MDVDRARRIRRDIARLCQSGLNSSSLGLEAERLLRTAVPFDRSCWHNVDPATSMLTSVIGESPPSNPLLPALEYGAEDINHYAELARAPVPAASLRQTTGGAPERSRRYREVLQPMGILDELTAAFVVDGMFWGCARLYRSNRWPEFDSVETAFVASLSTVFAEGFRSALIVGNLHVRTVADGPGVVVLDNHDRIESITPAAERWFSEVIDVMPGSVGPLPHMVFAVANRARAIDAGTTEPPPMARCRVPTRSGGWLVLHGTQLRRGAADRIAVIVESAPAAELAPLIVEAYGLTGREREIVRCVLQGLATKEIALALRISPFTVSDHLKIVFEKLGVRSRTELATRIFYDHYYPCLAGAAPLGENGWFIRP